MYRIEYVKEIGIFTKFNILMIAILFHANILNASVYDDDILNIYSKMLPRFIVMSSQKAKIKNNLEICVLYDKIDERTASSLIDKINSNYPHGISEFGIKVVQSSYTKLDVCQTSQLAFMFNSDETNIKNAILFLNKENILSMSYDESLLENGVEISLFIGRKVIPHINMKAIIQNKIELDNMLLRVSKIYMENSK
ncbi:MAG: YfiR/HmsC family protein [Sulfurimonas sp.]|jgi:hypothetical protein